MTFRTFLKELHKVKGKRAVLLMLLTVPPLAVIATYSERLAEWSTRKGQEAARKIYARPSK